MGKTNTANLAPQEAKVKNWIIGISIAIPLVVAVLLFMPTKLTSLGGWVYFLPHLNAIINSAASVALILALVFIKQKKYNLHGATMTVAFVLGAIFLVSYVIYHGAAESTPFGGEGAIRIVYYFLLIPISSLRRWHYSPSCLPITMDIPISETNTAKWSSMPIPFGCTYPLQA